MTVFLTTQYLEEADELADRIAVLNNGKIAAEGTAEELKRIVPGGHIPSDGSQRELRSILDRLDTAGVEADELTVHTPDLDDVFFALTDSATAPASVPAQPNQPKENAR